MALDLNKFIPRFVGEARDQLQRLETDIAALTDPPDAETVNALFRAAHTVKGSSRMLKLDGISETAHRLEDVLGALRDGRLSPEPALIELLLRGVDGISAQVDAVAANGAAPAADADLCRRLGEVASGSVDEQTEADADTHTAADADADGNSGADPRPGPGPGPGPDSEDRARGDAGAPESSPSAAEPVAPAGAARPPETIRLRLDKLDELIVQLGELVSCQVQMRQRLAEVQDMEPAPTPEGVKRFGRALRETIQEQDRLLGYLGDQALALRMLPLSTVFEPSARMVRQVARDLGKQVDYRASGGEIELDRQIIDRLGDALLHLLRNAIDHGLEPPDERRAAGKPARGQIRLSARHAEGGVVLTLHDDGRGLSRAALLAKAESRGLIEPGAGAQMADARVWELIFAPGLSTSPITTDLSGRGVGMDVVRRSVVDDLCGDLRIANEPGRGLTIELRVPLSLALTRVLLFRLGEQDLGLAARQVVALVRIGADEIHHVAHHPAISRHGSYVPLLSLAALLRLPGADDGDGTSLEERAAAGEGLLAVIVGAGGSQLALVVDRLLDERDMVIKSLPEHLSNTCSLVGGIVVAGDDRLASILQAPGLLALARRAGMPDLAGAAPTPTAGSTPTQRHILVVEDSLNTREIERELLEAAGYRVSLAEDGRAGLEFADQTEFDAVLTDVEMPRMTGFELTRRLREHPRYRTRPIIILTSLRNEADRQRGIEAGADAYMVKGDFEQSGLIATLAHLLP